MKFNLDQIETRLQELIEQRMFFPRRNTSLPHQLVQAMQEHLYSGPNGVATAPGSYVLAMHPRSLPWWQANPDALDRLSQALEGAARESGIRFDAPPSIRLSIDPALPLDAVRVTVAAAQAGGSTAAMAAAPVEAELSDTLPEGAYLIVNGLETFPLRQPVVNIGRRADNHIIINDARVSRAHAQLRAVRGRYLLFDLNASGGTFVNGIRISQQALKPGDVISLAGVPIIYSEETRPAQSDTTTLPAAR